MNKTEMIEAVASETGLAKTEVAKSSTLIPPKLSRQLQQAGITQ